MKISVIIPTYNEEKVIVDCLESLGNQTEKDFEIIVVDDGSKDNTPKILSRLQIASDDFVFLKQNHLGPGAARNLGAKKAGGEILVFVDSDMTFDKDFLKNLVKPITLKQTSGTWSVEEYVSNWNNTWARCWNINQGWKKERRHPKNYSSTQKVFRAILKSEFEKVGGFEKGGYTDDWSLSEKLGYEATLAPNARFYHKNPDDLLEVFYQAKWASKRKYKIGYLGVFLTLIKLSFPISLFYGLVKSLFSRTPEFLVFKLVYDFGSFLGVLEYIFTRSGSK